MKTAHFLPLDSVLQRASAIIHHGGIGTAGSALRQGIPQLIVPRVFAQPSNAEWMRRLGVAHVLAPRDYTETTALPLIARLLSESMIRDRAMQLSRRTGLDADIHDVCAAIEFRTAGVGDKRAQRNGGRQQTVQRE